MDGINTGRINVAVLIDAENVTPSKKNLEKIFKEARDRGNVSIKRIYGNFTAPNKDNPVLEYALTHIHCYSYVHGKNTADINLTVDAMELLHKNDIDVFFIVSSDSDFAPLVNKIIESGKTVIGMGSGSVVTSFLKACGNNFILLDDTAAEEKGDQHKTKTAVKSRLKTHSKKTDEPKVTEVTEVSDKTEKPETEIAEAVETEVTEAAPTKPSEASAVKTEDTDATENVTDSSDDGQETPPTAGNTAVKSIPETIKAKLLFALKAISRVKGDADGWITLTTAITELQKRIPGFSPKSLKFSNATKLMEALGLETKDKGSSNSCVKYGDGVPMDKALTDLAEISAAAIDVYKKNADGEGWIPVNHLLSTVRKLIPDFTSKKYGFSNATRLMEFWGAEFKDKGSAYTRIKLDPDQFPTFDTVAPISPENEEKEAERNTDSAETVTEDVTETESVTETAETDQPSYAESNAEATETKESEEIEEEEEEQTIDLPEVNELPDSIETVEDLKNVIIFVLTHESVSKPSRLTTAIQRYYPEFKIKNYGYTKMQQLLDALGLNVF